MDTFIGDIRLFAFPWAPAGFASCDGQLMSISQNQALFAILGTTYGGNGQTTFGLPDLRGRTPRGAGGNVLLGERAGASSHVLSAAEIPPHTHQVQVGGSAIDGSPTGLAPAEGPDEAYALPGAAVAMDGVAGNAGASHAHENMQPWRALHYAIALQGTFPTQGGSSTPGGESILGEVRMFAGNFAPRGWAFCDGRELQIQQYQPLFSLIGVIYGGNWTTTFRLPDLRGRIPLHRDATRSEGWGGGVEQVTLTSNELPGHGHGLVGSGARATDTSPAGNVPARTRGATYAPRSGDAGQVGTTPFGGSQPHDNMAPSLALSFIICTEDGIYPSRP